MALLERTFKFVKGLLGFSSLTQSARSNTLHDNAGSQVKNGGLVESRGGSSDIYENAPQQSGRSTKRKASEDVNANGRKRMRSNSSCSAHEFLPQIKRDRDRILMPPPAAPIRRLSSLSPDKPAQQAYLNNFDASSESPSLEANTDSVYDEYDAEQDHDGNDATVLPVDIENWDIAEQELYQHLARRGREALVPQNWMIDFPTLPISLFATKPHHVPLIELHRSTEFRATKALGDLIDTGKTVRDRAISATTELRSEITIQKATNKYIKWALKDIGVSSKKCIPVHTVVAMKPGQTTRDTIQELAVKMHRLSANHREECNILASIEREEDAQIAGGSCTTTTNQNAYVCGHKLPIIYGIMICSSVLAIFTLDSHIAPPPSIAKQLSRETRNETEDQDTDSTQSEDKDEDEDPNLRYIWRFDFSDHRADVWNAFVIVITAMMIRKTLRHVYDIPTVGDEQDYEESVFDSSLMDGDLGGSQNKYLARYAAGQQSARGLGLSGSENEDDPDL